MSARDDVLARIRSALDGGEVPDIVRSYNQGSPGDVGWLVDRLVDRLEDYKATVHRCAVGEVGGVIDRALADAAIRKLVVPPGIDPSWLLSAEGRQWDGETVFDDGLLRPADLDGDDVAVVTSCSVAIAESGTIVLDGGPGQGRRVLTLVPDYHLCVVGADQVVGAVPDAIRRLDPTRPLTWISGPSATSDIELRRVEGVHGPRHLIVILAES